MAIRRELLCGHGAGGGEKIVSLARGDCGGVTKLLDVGLGESYAVAEGVGIAAARHR